MTNLLGGFGKDKGFHLENKMYYYYILYNTYFLFLKSMSVSVARNHKLLEAKENLV